MFKVLEPARGPDWDLSDGRQDDEPRAFAAQSERRFERDSESLVARHVEQPFDQQFERYWGTVFGLLYRLMGTREEAEDLAQEVFLKLYQRGPSRGPANDREANVGGWLYRVATNLGYNALRGRRRRVAREERVAAADITVEDAPLAAVVAAEERAAVRLVLSTLSERQQACLILRYGGLAYAEIAESLGIAPGSVGTILARAEREFRKRFEAQNGGLSLP